LCFQSVPPYSSQVPVKIVVNAGFYNPIGCLRYFIARKLPTRALKLNRNPAGLLNLMENVHAATRQKAFLIIAMFREMCNTAGRVI
jgi:hypothetical protein